jgi:hypothetical protein
MIMDQQSQDFYYFLENMENFYQTYGHRYVVVKNKDILGVYDTFEEALETTLKTEELGSFLVQECFASKENMIHHFQGNVVPVPV